MGADVGIMISAQLIEADIKRQIDVDDVTVAIESVARWAFESCLKNSSTWLLHSEEEKFRAGVGGLLLYFKDNDDVRERIEYEMKGLQTLSAATSGIPVNFGAILRDDIEPIGMMRIFKEVRGEQG